jgi:hypothetical protein
LESNRGIGGEASRVKECIKKSNYNFSKATKIMVARIATAGASNQLALKALLNTPIQLINAKINAVSVNSPRFPNGS